MLRRPAPLTTSPLVSVVVPCYNYGRFLPQCLDSVLSQPGVRVEVLVVDDASPDGSGEVAEALAEKDDRVRVLRHRENAGHIRTYNHGLAEVDGDYVVLLSADDALTPGSLQRSVALMEAHSSVGLAYGHPRNVRDEDLATVRVSTTVRSWSMWRGRDWAIGRCRRGRNPLYSPEVVLRGDVQRRIGGYDPDLPHSGDLDMWLRAAQVSDVGRVNGPDQALRRIHGNNMSETTFAGELRDFLERRKAFDAYFDGFGSTVPDRDRLRALARRSVSRAALDHACAVTRRGDASAHEIEQVVGFVEESVPEPSRLRQWRELMWRLDGGPHRVGGRLLDAVLAGHRNLDHRVAWRRWRWSGV